MRDIVIQSIPVSKIKPAKYNPRKELRPGDFAYDRLKDSIEAFGFVEPLVWNKKTGNLVGGHQRFKILVASGVIEADCAVVDLDQVREKALNLALNRIEGEWDFPKLKLIIDELAAHGVDPEMTGFTKTELDQMIGTVVESDDVDFDEYNEAVEGEVKTVVCPECGYEFVS